jgi:uncharacterized membrane protein YecN with MAPEG domain
MSDAELRIEAKKIAENKFWFYVHVVLYIVINIFLIIMFNLSGADSPLVILPPVGWAIGLLFHYLAVFARQITFSLDGMVEREYEKLKKG